MVRYATFSGSPVTQVVQGSTGDKNFYAKWELSTFTLTFDGNGATPNPASKQVTSNTAIGTLPTVALEGNTFIAWFIGSTCITDATVWNYTENKTAVAHYINVEATDVTCAETSTGTITATTSPASPSPYTVQLYKGTTELSAYTNLAAGLYQVKVTPTGGCDEVLVPIGIGDMAPLAPGTVSGTQTLCAGNVPAPFINVEEATSGAAGDITYQWQQSSDNNTFTDITGATNASYDPEEVDGTTYYRRKAIQDGCGSPVYSNVLTVTAYPIVECTISETDVVCNGEADGYITVTADDYTDFEVFCFKAGETTPSGAWEAPNIKDLSAGTYYVLIIDANGCPVTISRHIE